MLGGTPVPSGGHPAETAGPPHALLSSRFSFVAALAPPSRFLFGRPPAPAPCLLSPCVCVGLPLRPPRRPPLPSRLLLARPGSASGRNWQRPPGGRSRVSAAHRPAEPRRVRDPRQVSVGPSRLQACRAACTVARGARRSGWRHRCRRGRWAGSGPTGLSGGALKGPWPLSRWPCGAAWLGGPGLLDGAGAVGAEPREPPLCAARRGPPARLGPGPGDAAAFNISPVLRPSA